MLLIDEHIFVFAQMDFFRASCSTVYMLPILKGPGHFVKKARKPINHSNAYNNITEEDFFKVVRLAMGEMNVSTFSNQMDEIILKSFGKHRGAKRYLKLSGNIIYNIGYIITESCFVITIIQIVLFIILDEKR